MKCLAKICTSALVFGALIMAGSGSVSANHVRIHPRISSSRNVSLQSRNAQWIGQTTAKRHINQPAKKIPNSTSAQFNRSKIAKVAKSKLGDPYVYGATGRNHFDCSGFTQYVYRHGAHIILPRTAQAQYNVNPHVSYQRAKAGNLVFFGRSSSRISHVGMYLGNGKMIDAQNRGVVIENVVAPWWNLVGCAQVTA